MVHDRGQLIRKEARTYETEEQKKNCKKVKVKKRNLKTQLTNSPQPPFSALEKKEGEKNEDIETMSMNNQHPRTQIGLEMSGERD